MSVTYKTISDLTAATDSQVDDDILLEVAVEDQTSDSGYASRKVTKGQLVADIKEDLPYITVENTSLIIQTGVVNGNEVEF